MVRKVAHDSGDGQTIYHCPFCGSGQVIARSDRTIECQFCHICFTVQVQPQFPAFPQTIDGQPVQVPGMPGQIGAPSMGGGMGADPADPNAGMDAGAPVDPSQVGADGSVPPGGDEAAGGPPGGEDEGSDDDSGGDSDSKDDKGGDGPPWAKKSSLQVADPEWLRTAEGRWLSPEDYARHLAIRAAPPHLRRSVAAAIKEQRS